MEYTIQKLAALAGVSARALRYYDEVGLLKPKRVSSNGYRIYGAEQIDALQQILFFKELGLELNGIKAMMEDPSFDRETALTNHLCELESRKNRLERLIETVTNTLKDIKGEIQMTDKEKFEGFKDSMIAENEEKFGQEAREKYGDSAVNASNAKFKGMTQEQMKDMERLTAELSETLKAACAQGDPTSETARRAVELHRDWLCIFWTEYNKDMHIGVTEMYVSDPRFTEYYEKIVPGGAAFLRDAVSAYFG